MKPIADWLPHEHIDRAAQLLERFDKNYDEEGKFTGNGGGGYVITPVALTLAELHLNLAEAKMKGRQRA